MDFFGHGKLKSRRQKGFNNFRPELADAVAVVAVVVVVVVVVVVAVVDAIVDAVVVADTSAAKIFPALNSGHVDTLKHFFTLLSFFICYK